MAPDPATLQHDPAPNVVEPQARLADFDEQLWPVNLLLLALTGLVAGWIWTRGDFHAREPWTNGYVHLGILGAIVVVWGLAAVLMRRGDQRRMQLAVLASLLLHVWLSVGMQQYQLPMVRSLHPHAAARALDRALPDYHFHQLEHPSEKQFFEKPLETDAAPQIAKQAHEPPAAANEVVPASQPAATKPLKPELRPIDIQRADASAPHRGQRLPGPQKTPSQKLAEPQPAVAERPKPEAGDQLRSLPDSPEPAAGRERPAAELEPRVAMARRPRADSLPELKAAPAGGAPSRADAPPAAVTPSPAADRLARSDTRDRLDPQGVPISPAVPAPGAGPGDSPLKEIEPTAGRAPRSDAAVFAPPPGLPLASPGFEGPTMPLGARIPGDSGGSTMPEFEQPALSWPTRARREDLPLASDARVAGAAGRSATSAGHPGSSGEFEANLAPRVRHDLELPLSPSGAVPDGSNEEPSLGHLPGAPVAREMDFWAIPSPAAAPAPPVPMRKHASDALIGGSAGPGSVAPAPAAVSRAAESASRASEQTAGRGVSPAALPLRSPAPPSGPAQQATLDPGVASRRARPESEMLATDTPRMILERSGGELAIDARVRDTAVPGLKQRDRIERKAIAQQRGGSIESEQAVERGLAFLSRFQATDGSWQLHNAAPGFDYQAAGIPQMNSTTAATGLALLSFLGSGYTHTDGPHRQVVERALNHLLAHQRADGDLYQPQDALSNSSAWLYSHGIAAIAICEAYGMTRDRRLRDGAQRALDFIAAAQNPDEGGWRYSPRRGSDTSVSGWQLMALKSGELAGLKVPRDCYARVAGWLDRAEGVPGLSGRYAYQPSAENPAYRAASTVMTAEALLMRQYLGWRRDHPDMIAGAQWLEQNLPRFGTPSAGYPTAERNAYYWYYGTQVMFQMQGPYWETWNARLRPLLLESQVTGGEFAGSWDPVRPLPDRYGYMVGRLYVTAMHLLVLEVYYRHLPIYQTLEDAVPRP